MRKIVPISQMRRQGGREKRTDTNLPAEMIPELTLEKLANPEEPKLRLTAVSELKTLCFPCGSTPHYRSHPPHEADSRWNHCLMSVLSLRAAADVPAVRRGGAI